MNRKTELKQKFKQLLTIAFASMMVLGSALPAVTETASAFTGKVGSSYTVTDGGRITYGSGDGGYSNSRKCDLGDGLGSRYTYCVQPAKASPPTGKVTVDKVITDSDDKGKWNALRNIVFYSPSYPGYEKNISNIKGAYYTGNFTKDWAIAHLAMAYVYEGRPSDMATWGGTKASGLGDIWTKAKKLGDGLWNADSEKDESIRRDIWRISGADSACRRSITIWMNSMHREMPRWKERNSPHLTKAVMPFSSEKRKSTREKRPSQS